MTDDSTLNGYLYTLQSLCDELYSIKDDISNYIQGVGEEYCKSNLEFIANCYSNIKNNVVNAYYMDKSNNI